MLLVLIIYCNLCADRETDTGSDLWLLFSAGKSCTKGAGEFALLRVISLLQCVVILSVAAWSDAYYSLLFTRLTSTNLLTRQHMHVTLQGNSSQFNIAILAAVHSSLPLSHPEAAVHVHTVHVPILGLLQAFHFEASMLNQLGVWRHDGSGSPDD